uniref:NADH-ubiquinone oxidoreductase chain 4L n=1 Tax=Candida bohioensis TaxID=561986 RepID=U3MH86_9ASCO|nr:NADH dehydrogenase subunit 4L [Candida bohioensis]AGW07361.1 NADH dehydrogenase subunit 4L [Candida bohioensis]
MMALITTMLLFYLSSSNIMGLTMAMEMLLLTVTVQLMQYGGAFNDMYGTMYSLMMIMLAGAESAMGLSMLVAYYKIRGKMGHMM